MTKDAKQQILTAARLRYQRAGKQERSQILNEVCNLTQLHRKYVTRRLGAGNKLKVLKKPGRKKIYSAECEKLIPKIWFAMQQPCSKRMVKGLSLWMPDFIREWGLSERLSTELLSISSASIDRVLRPHRAQYRRKWHSRTRPGTLLKQMIPIKPLGNTVLRPGFVEADTVAHCGGSLMGEFIWSITMTDTCLGWTENRAIYGKSAEGVVESVKEIEEVMPFEFLGFSTDNGSEFLNEHLVRYFAPSKEKPRPGMIFCRSRAYKKNDQCYVEQKNWTHVRELFGYDRFDRRSLIPLMNSIYKDQALLQNFFMPQMKLISKIRVGSKYMKKYDEPKTPYQRLLEKSEYIKPETLEELRHTFESLNPLQLQRDIESKLKIFFQEARISADMRAQA